MLRVTRSVGTAVIYLSGNAARAPLVDQRLMAIQLLYTLRQVTDITSVRLLAAGRTFSAPPALGSASVIGCTLSATPVEFADPSYPVRMQGSTDVIAALDPSLDATAR